MPQANLLKLLSFIFVFSFSIFAQNLTETHQKIQNAVEKKDFQTAITELQNFEKSDEKVFEVNNYDYLLARTAEKRDDLALAMANYQKVADRNSVLSEYALWHLSRIVRASGNLMIERIYLQKILLIAPDSILSEAVKTRIVHNLFESGNFEEVIAKFHSAKDFSPESNSKIIVVIPAQDKVLGNLTGNEAKTRENLVLLGESYMQVGKKDEARQVFTKLINTLANPAQPDDFALAGAKNLDLLDVGSENFGKIAPQLNDNENYRRALIYQFNRNFPLARLHFQAIVERFPNSTFVANSLYQIGRGFAQEGNFSQAIDWFERIQVEFPNDDIARDALTQTASAYSRLNKPKEAISRYQKFIQTYPNADNLERAFLNIVDILRDQGENAEALKWTAKTQIHFKGKLPEAIALFAQARIHISQNDWTNALSELNSLLTFPDLGGTKVPGGTNKAEVIFLKGLTLENLNRFPEAIDVYLSIPDGRNEYYGWRATERLQNLLNNEKTQEFIQTKLIQLMGKSGVLIPNEERKVCQNIYRLKKNPKTLEAIKSLYVNLPDYQKTPNFKLLEFGRKKVLNEKPESSNGNHHKFLADELLFLGLYDEGTPELDIYFQQTQTKITDDIAFTLATFYKRGDWANKAVSFIEPIWRKVPADYQIELIPREQLELLYPVPYSDALLQSAPPRNIDPRFILSIMRQESSFRADVKSYAAARGLMQFISTTATQIAQQLNRENFKQNELYNPPTAILFGSQYLSNLFEQFPNQPAAVAASYNGGEDNMARWLARAKSDDPDRYVSEIVFTQSKDYVYKVMAAYRIYQMFYDENLKIK